ncbi:cupin domain-containing protein [Flavobacterium branchiicola]|uniref:Cupin domain-containing protein n=1 Tax=Flavobacterium branchiicola TaxID=1114875 RepID=A0ABV9PDN8_9FLAO|nr:cupin domain-containing protein [Flavobacterium branchiicola]MBS7254016.1 cupin domain-containing protein [Flavobacterium branchiicola]
MKPSVFFKSFLILSFIIGYSQNSIAQGISTKEFNSINAETIVWKSFPAFPEKVKLAILVGNPAKPEPFVVRVKVPNGEKIMPHKHPEDRIYTVISGVFYIGIGEQFDETKLKAYAPGSVIVLPGNTPHFHLAKSGEYISQVSAFGPLGLEYLDKNEDPRIQHKN